MRQIKVKFVDFWADFVPEESHLYRMLARHYDVQIVQEDPDYVFCSVFGPPFTSCTYPQVRILYSGENFVPDFNWVDYAISSYPITFQDRACRHPGCVDLQGHCLALQGKDRAYPDNILAQKPYFANFIASHESEYGLRGDFFKKLCAYKRVESPGSYLNNMPGGETVDFKNDSKTDFQRRCKFTLCFESTSHRGFITEKITDAFYADTIPVYYGDPDAARIFNPEAFIDCGAFASFDKAIQRIVELDNDDAQYLAMLRQPIFRDPEYPSKVLAEEEAFLCSIIDQPMEKAYRRSRVYWAGRYNGYIAAIPAQAAPAAPRRTGLRRAASWLRRAAQGIVAGPKGK